MIRPAEIGDAGAIARIYNHYVQHTTITFEEVCVPDSTIAERISETLAGRLPFMVAAPDGIVQGFAYASPWKGRCAYRFSSEVTVYLRPGAEGRGLGTALYSTLIPQLKAQGMHTLLAGIALPNRPSEAFHEKFGFNQVALLREVGRKFERWVDVGYWQLIL